MSGKDTAEPADPTQAANGQTSLIGLFAAIMATAACGVGFGLSLPLISLRLNDLGAGGAAIGLVAFAAGVSGVLASPFVPRLMQKFGVRWALAFGLGLSALSFFLFPLADSVFDYSALRVMLGAGLAIVFVTSESWILLAAPPHRRGLALGVYVSTLAGSFGLGAALIAFIGHEGTGPFLIGGAIMVLGLIPILFPAPVPTPPDGDEARPLALLRRLKAAPLLFAGPLVMAIIESAALFLLPVFGREIALTDSQAAGLVAAYGFGNLALQVPIGWLADKIGIKPTLWIMAVLAMVGPFVILPVMGSVSALYLIVLIYSGAVTAIYTLSLAGMAHQFSPGQLASANALMALIYSFGQASGGFLSGLALDLGGPVGFLSAQSAYAALFVLALVLSARQRP
jgi:MFS family permease